MAMKNEKRYGFTFIWEIHNFSSCFQKNGECLFSPEFTVDYLDGSRWYMQLYPRGEQKDCEKYMSLFLCRCGDDENEEVIVIDDKVELIGPEGDILRTIFGESTIYEKPDGKGWRNFFEIADISKAIQKWHKDTLTIRYHIARSKSTDMCLVKTKVAGDHRSVKWKIPKPDSSDWSVTKIVSLSETFNLEINLTAPIDDVLINIRKIQGMKPSLGRILQCRISLLGIEGTERYTKEVCYPFEFHDINNSWEFPSFFKISQLNCEDNEILKNGKFTIEWICFFSERIESEEIENYFSTLKVDMRDMFSNKKYSDVKLKSEYLVLPAHKSVLSSRSPVFEAMFEQDMLENRTGTVDIIDMDEKTLSSFLEYLYTDTVSDFDTGSALNLLLAADKYQVQSLKTKCSSFLMSEISMNNVREVLVVADMLRHKLLKSAALEYIKSHKEKLLSSSKWKKWLKKNKELASEIFLSLSLDSTEVVYEF